MLADIVLDGSLILNIALGVIVALVIVLAARKLLS